MFLGAPHSPGARIRGFKDFFHDSNSSYAYADDFCAFCGDFCAYGDDFCAFCAFRGDRRASAAIARAIRKLRMRPLLRVFPKVPPLSRSRSNPCTNARAQLSGRALSPTPPIRVEKLAHVVKKVAAILNGNTPKARNGNMSS